MKLIYSMTLILISFSLLAAGDETGDKAEGAAGADLYNDIMTSLSDSDIEEVENALNDSEDSGRNSEESDIHEVEEETVSEGLGKEALERAAEAENLPDELKDKVIQRMQEMEKKRKNRPVEFREKQ